jgi:hypothetical protein
MFITRHAVFKDAQVDKLEFIRNQVMKDSRPITLVGELDSIRLSEKHQTFTADELVIVKEVLEKISKKTRHTAVRDSADCLLQDIDVAYRELTSVLEV